VVTPATNIEVDPTQIPLPEDNPQQPQQQDIKLPPFWTTRPRAWFTFVESRFRLRGIEDVQSRFDHVLSALPAEMILQVIDIVNTMPAAGLYEHFKNQLLEVHQLSDYEKFDVLIKMEPMGGRKPSQLLHAMLEFCPVGGRSISPSTISTCSGCLRPCRRSWAKCSRETRVDWLLGLSAFGLCTPLPAAWRW
jgi:hypothetical protein